MDRGSLLIPSFIFNLHLKRCEQAVLSVIYAFTVGKYGLCFAGIEKLCEMSSYGKTSVYNALGRLVSLGYIEKVNTGKLYGYRALVFEKESKDIREVSENENCSTFPTQEEEKNEEAKNEEAKNEEENNEDERVAPKEPEKENTAPLYEGQYYKEYMKVFGKYRNLPPPEYSLECYGNHKNVLLTEKQYEALFRLVGYDRLSLYIARLDVLIKNNEKTGKSPPHSAYATIKKWIKKDMEA